jgi:hypothetical protein
MPVLRSLFTRRRQRRSQLWTPSTRELWCYAIILAASRVRKPSATDVTTTGGAADPRKSPDAILRRNCVIASERELSDRLKCRVL